MSLTKDICEKACEKLSKVYAIDDVPVRVAPLMTPLCEKEVNIFKQLIEEHFELIEENKRLIDKLVMQTKVNIHKQKYIAELVKGYIEISKENDCLKKKLNKQPLTFESNTINIDFMLKNIKRWIDLRLKEGYKIKCYGISNGLKEIHIYFEKEDKNNVS